LEKKKKKM